MVHVLSGSAALHVAAICGGCLCLVRVLYSVCLCVHMLSDQHHELEELYTPLLVQTIYH